MAEAQVSSQAGRRLRGSSSNGSAVHAMNATVNLGNGSGGLQVMEWPAEWSRNVWDSAAIHAGENDWLDDGSSNARDSENTHTVQEWPDGGSSNASTPQWRNVTIVLPNASNTTDVRHAGPGYCVTTWKAEPGHGADYAIDNEWTALKHVDLNHCLMHCWATTNCYCVNFHHDIDHTGHPLNTFNQWMDTGTCF